MLSNLIAWIDQILYAIDYWVDWPVAIGLAIGLTLGGLAVKGRRVRRNRATSAATSAEVTRKLTEQRGNKRLLQR